MISYFFYAVIGLLLFTQVLAYIIGWDSVRFGSAKIFRGHKSLKWKNKGLVIDGKRSISPQRSCQHLLLTAPTGVGKTTVYTFTNLLQLDSSMVLTDVKGELHDICSGYLAEKGFSIRVLDLADIARSIHFNPLKRLNSQDEIKFFCESLFTMSNKGATTEGIWRQGSINVLEILIRCLKNTSDEKYANLANLIHLMRNINLSDNAKGLEDFIVTYAPDEETFQRWRSFLNQEEKIKAGQLSGAMTILSPFDTKNVNLLTQNDSFDFAEIRNQKTCLFLKVPVGKSKEFAPILTLFYGQLFDYLLTDPIDQDSQYVYFLLEEFGNLLKINNFSQVVSLIRSKKVSLSIICQDIEQIDHIYGKSVSQTITSNCGSFLVFPGIKSERTHKMIEMLIGTTTYVEEDEAGKTHVNPRKTMDCFEVRTMKKNRGLYIFNDLPAIKLRMTPIYKNTVLLRKAEIKSKDGMLVPNHPSVNSEWNPTDEIDYVLEDMKDNTPRANPTEVLEISNSSQTDHETKTNEASEAHEPQALDLKSKRLNDLLAQVQD